MSKHGVMTSRTLLEKSPRLIGRWTTILFFAFALHAFALFAAGDESKKIYVCPPCNADCDKVEHEAPGTCEPCGMPLVDKNSLPSHEKEKPKVTVYICPPCGSDCDKVVHKKPGTCAPCGMALVAKDGEDGK